MTGGVLRTAAGRPRLGWRLLAFLTLALAVSLVAWPLLPGGLLSGSAAMLAGSLVAGWALLALDGHHPRALGFPVSRTAPIDAGLGLGLGVALGLLVVGVIVVGGGLRWAAQEGTTVGWVTGALGALAFLAIPAAAEEALLRGYPLQALADGWGVGASLVVTSIVFGAIHLGNPEVTLLGIANVMAAGLFLGVVYLKTASLWYATGAHLGWNWSHGYLADVPVSGLELLDAPFYEGIPAGPVWLGGGAFGPEGSAVATVLVLAAAWGCWKSERLRPAGAAAPWWGSGSGVVDERPEVGHEANRGGAEA